MRQCSWKGGWIRFLIFFCFSVLNVRLFIFFSFVYFSSTFSPLFFVDEISLMGWWRLLPKFWPKGWINILGQKSFEDEKRQSRIMERKGEIISLKPPNYYQLPITLYVYGIGGWGGGDCNPPPPNQDKSMPPIPPSSEKREEKKSSIITIIYVTAPNYRNQANIDRKCISLSCV